VSGSPSIVTSIYGGKKINCSKQAWRLKNRSGGRANQFPGGSFARLKSSDFHGALFRQRPMRPRRSKQSSFARCAAESMLLMAVKTFAGLLTVTLAIPRMFGGWQVGPVLFARQGFPRRFALNLRKEHPAQVIAAVYRI